MRKYLYALDNLEKVDKIKRSFKKTYSLYKCWKICQFDKEINVNGFNYDFIVTD